jgi:periplasmic protein TonB
MGTVASHRGLEVAPPASSGAEPPVLPTLFGEGYGLYQTRPLTFVYSFVGHVLLIALLAASGHFVVSHRREIRQQVMNVVTDISPYILPASKSKAGGGGGGGDRDKLLASKGALPRLSREQITPPAVVIRNDNPKLAVEPTVVVPPQIHLPQTGTLGDPLSAVLGPPSNGPGFGGGIGSGSGGGVGSGTGPGVGPGHGGGIGGGVYRVGGGVSAPRPIYSPDPDYSEEARKAKYQGTVVLWVIVGSDGRPHDIRVYRSLGMGLDEKAIEKIKTWRFDPARKDGIPVAVQVNIEVSFRLY